MVDAALVTMFERINGLDDDALDEFVLAEEHAVPDDGVKVAGANIVYEEGVTALVNLTMEGEHVGMGRDAGMELPLASLVILVSLPLDTFDGIFYASLGVESAVYDAECPRTQNRHNGECAVIDGLSQGLGCRRRVRHSGWGGLLKTTKSRYRELSRLVDWFGGVWSWFSTDKYEDKVGRCKFVC